MLSFLRMPPRNHPVLSAQPPVATSHVPGRADLCGLGAMRSNLKRAISSRSVVALSGAVVTAEGISRCRSSRIDVFFEQHAQPPCSVHTVLCSALSSRWTTTVLAGGSLQAYVPAPLRMCMCAATHWPLYLRQHHALPGAHAHAHAAGQDDDLRLTVSGFAGG